MEEEIERKETVSRINKENNTETRERNEKKDTIQEGM